MKQNILIVDDDPDLLRLLSLRLEGAGYQVTAVSSAEAALAILVNERPHVVLSDIQLPQMDGLKLFSEIHAKHPTLPVILLTAHGTIPDAVAATAQGVFGYLTKPFDSQQLLNKIADALDLYPKQNPLQSNSFSWAKSIITRSNQMHELLNEALLVAQSDASVMIRGESGTGKELLARAIHDASPRVNKPFTAINCGAIPESLLESELFGHTKGAFTGATQDYEGLLRTTDGGTLFLDEIGDMPPSLQVKLLRTLQDKIVRPVGSSRNYAVDVRILSATHQNLEENIQNDTFRSDLYYRLNVVELTLPPLRQRPEDIPLLAQHFLAQLSHKHQKSIQGFAPEALRALTTTSWPGNIRQLFNVIEQVTALCSTPLIPLSLVQRALRHPTTIIQTYSQAKERFEFDYLSNLLKITGGQVADAARLADRNRTEFYRLLQKHHLTPDSFRTQVSLPSDSKNQSKS